MSAAGTTRGARLRLDELLVARGLASSRAEAARLILAGRVRLPGGVPAKAGRLVAPDVEVEQVAAAPFVGRGGEKLAGALDALGVGVAGRRVGMVMMCTMVGMALGGWMSGKVFDLTGSYEAAFLNGIAWNALNLSVTLFLLRRGRRLVSRAQVVAT